MPKPNRVTVDAVGRDNCVTNQLSVPKTSNRASSIHVYTSKSWILIAISEIACNKLQNSLFATTDTLESWFNAQ